MANKYDTINQMLKEYSQEITHSPKNWMSFLNTVSWMYKYSFSDQILIHAQKPEATSCAEFDVWNNRYHRWINKGAKGIALIDDSGKYGKIRYVFDISDTKGYLNRELKLWEVSEDMHDDVIEALCNQYDWYGNENDLGEALMAIAHLLVEENSADYVKQILHYKEDSALDGLSDEEVIHDYKTILENSLTYTLMKRSDVDTSFYLNEDDFNAIVQFNTIDTIGILGTAHRDTAEMVLNEIGKVARECMIEQNRTFVKQQKTVDNNREENERSDLNERNDIQPSGRLSDAESEVDGRTTNREIRNATHDVLEEPSTSTTLLTQSEQHIEPVSKGNPIRSGETSKNADGRIIEETASTEQRSESDGMGSSHEQSEISSRTARSGRADLQLNLNLGDIEVKEPKIPPFSLSDLETILKSEVSLSHKKEEVVAYFHEHTDVKERADYLESCYQDTYTEIFRKPENYDFSHIGYRKDGYRLEVWSNSYLKMTSQSFYSFDYLQEEVSRMIDEGTYLEPLYLDMTPLQKANKIEVLNSNAIRVLLAQPQYLSKSSAEVIDFFHEHSNEEDRIQFLKEIYPDIAEFIYDGVALGYEKKEDGLNLFFGTNEKRKKEELMRWSSVVSDTNGLIVSRLFDPSVQIPTLEEQKNAVYESIEAFNNGKYFSHEEITLCLIRGSNFADSKFRIYEQFQKHQSVEEDVNFLKHEYGTGGSSNAFPGAFISDEHSSKGIRLTKQKWIGVDDVSILLKWKDVRKRIYQLIESDHYLTDKEKGRYPLYLKKKQDLALEFERRKIENDLNVIDNEPSIVDKPKRKEYIYAVGDTVYIGADTYEIQDLRDGVYLTDKNFPLFSKTFTDEEFLRYLKDNPLNEHLLKEVEINLKDVAELYFPILLEEVQKSEIYEGLRDSDTDVEEARELLDTKLSEIINQTQTENHDLYLSYMQNDEFKGKLLDNLFEKTYQDISHEIDFNDFEVKTSYQDFYEKFIQLGKDVVEKKCCFMTLNSESSKETLTITNYRNELNKIEMYQTVAIGETELVEPYMTFEINREEKTLRPISYRNSDPDVELEISVHSMYDDEIQNELNYYAEDWLNTLIDSHYQLSYGQFYKDNVLSDTYQVSVSQDGIVSKQTDMPYSVLKTFSEEHGFKISSQVQEKIDFVIEDENLGAGTPKERYRNNVNAIQLLKQLENENRNATSEEQIVLSKYVGWGGLADAFDETKSSWAKEYEELKKLLSEDEYDSARASTLTAFYTPPVVIESIYKALEKMNFNTGNILEPACGTGNFFGKLPQEMKHSKLYGVELDSITGKIAKQLYQNANITVQGYEEVNLPDSFFDVAIGNIPFGQFKVLDKRYDQLNFNIHDYFFAKTIDKVRPGGIIAFITSRFTLDKKTSTARKYISERAELVGAVRLPNNTFKESAGTQTVSDIIFLKKRERPIVNDESWIHTQADENGNILNSYFIEHPEMVLGTIEKCQSMYGREDLTVIPHEGVTLKEELTKAIQNIHTQIDDYIVDDTLEKDNGIQSIPADPNVRNFSYTVVDGDIYYRENSVMNKVDVSDTVKNRIIGLVQIRDSVRKLIELQSNDVSEDEIKAEQQKLNELYDQFTIQYGLINSRGNTVAFRDDSSFYLLSSLENLNEDGTLKSKADMFTKRTIRKKKEINHVDTANEALMVSLSEKAKVDLDYMSQLCGRSKETLVHDLNGIIYRVPKILDENEQPEYITANEYLSGNIREKLKEAELASKLDSSFKSHVEALTNALPKALTASEIEVNIGATWVPPEVYRLFLYGLLGTPSFYRGYIDVLYSDMSGTWNV